MIRVSFKTALVLVALFFVSNGSSAEATSQNYCLKVPVLMYHHIQPFTDAQAKNQAAHTVDSAMFESHLAYLNHQGYHTIEANQLVQALINHSSLPPKSVVITVDDGYVDVYTYAYPLAKKYAVHLNLMISTGLMNNPDYLTWDQLKTMVAGGSVSTYNHTWSHANVTKISPQKFDFEISTAALQLQNNLGQNARIFSYPYGDKNAKVKELLKQKGFLAAFSTMPGINQCDQNLFDLPRVRIGNIPLSRYGL